MLSLREFGELGSWVFRIQDFSITLVGFPLRVPLRALKKDSGHASRMRVPSGDLKRFYRGS